MESKFRKLKDKMRENFLGADLMICILIAALKSYRSDKCLRPFPPMFINRGEKDWQKLNSICDTIPPLKELVSNNDLPQETIDLLTWMYIESGFPQLQLRNLEHIPVENRGGLRKLLPQYIFEVCYPESTEKAFQKRIGNNNTIFAYHGSALDNFYSILRVGLQQHFSFKKEGLFGNGVYLSSEITVCTTYAPFRETWKNSCLGSQQSIIAICEVIDHIDKVKCKDTKHRQRSRNEESYNEIPEKYYVVTDSEMLRVKYLLVYSRKKIIFSIKNVSIFLIISYLLILVLTGLFRGTLWTKLMKIFSL